MGGGKVFISYSHDTAGHQQHVLDLSNSLRAIGVDAELDRYYVRPKLGWPRWSAEQLRPDVCRFVIVVCTPIYRDRVEGKVRADAGRGVFWEGGIIGQYLYDEKGNERFIPVLLKDEPETSIPQPLKGHAFYTINAFDLSDPGFDALYRELTIQPAIVKPTLGPEVVREPRRIPAPIVGTPLPKRQALTSFPPSRSPPPRGVRLKLSLSVGAIAVSFTLGISIYALLRPDALDQLVQLLGSKP